MKDLSATVSQIFEQRHHIKPIVICSPGRINLIGEHTDYNMGFVLPAAIDKGAYVALSKRNDDTINLYAVDMGEEFTSTISNYNTSD